jgi:hypothetical protein
MAAPTAVNQPKYNYQREVYGEVKVNGEVDIDAIIGPLPEGDAHIGKVSITDGTNTLAITGDGEAWARVREHGTFATRLIAYTDLPTDSQIQSISDGVNLPVIFEFDPAEDGVTGVNVPVVYDPEDGLAGMLAVIVPLINTSGLNITAAPTEDGYLLTSTVLGSAGVIDVTGPADVCTIADLEAGLDEVTLRTLQDAPVTLDADARKGQMKSCKVTLTLADTVYPVALFSWVRGIRLRPDKDIRWALDENPPANEAVTDGAVDLADFGTGNYAFANESEVRMVEPGKVTNINLLCDQAGAVVIVEYYA